MVYFTDVNESSEEQAIDDNVVDHTKGEDNAMGAIDGNHDNETSNLETLSGPGIKEPGEELPGQKKVQENINGRPIVDGAAGMSEGSQRKGEPLHNSRPENQMHDTQHRPNGHGQNRPNKKQEWLVTY